MTNPVYFIDSADFDGLSLAASYDLVGNEGHHARTVKRAQLGEGIDLADGAGRRAVGTVAALLDGGVRVAFEDFLEAPAGVQMYLVQALAKGERDIQAIEMATELGAHGLVPWAADRSIVRWKADRAVKARTKWQNTVRAAAKQSRRALIPEVFEHHSTANLVELAEELGQRALFLVLHEQASFRLTEALGQHLTDSVEAIYFLVGPEGGVSPRELAALEAAGAHAVLLGEEVLRSSTAGAAALATLNVQLGRW